MKSNIAKYLLHLDNNYFIGNYKAFELYLILIIKDIEHTSNIKVGGEFTNFDFDELVGKEYIEVLSKEKRTAIIDSYSSLQFYKLDNLAKAVHLV